MAMNLFHSSVALMSFCVLALSPLQAQDDIEAELNAMKNGGLPEDAARSEALKTVKEVFKDDYKGQKPDDASKLAKNLLDKAGSESDPGHVSKCGTGFQPVHIQIRRRDACATFEH